MEETKEIKNHEIKLEKLLDKITEVYIGIILLLFPLCVDSTGFFRILECKYRTFLIFAGTYLALNLIIIIYYYIFHKVKIWKKIRLSKIQYAVIIFWIINIVSCLMSPYFDKYNLFVGVGRRRRFNKYIFILFNIYGYYIVWKIQKKIYIIFFNFFNFNKCNSNITICRF